MANLTFEDDFLAFRTMRPLLDLVCVLMPVIATMTSLASTAAIVAGIANPSVCARKFINASQLIISYQLQILQTASYPAVIKRIRAPARSLPFPPSPFPLPLSFFGRRVDEKLKEHQWGEASYRLCRTRPPGDNLHEKNFFILY